MTTVNLNVSQIKETLKEIIDPELGINIVDLGLIYDITVKDSAIGVMMTLTTPGCPMSVYLPAVTKEILEDNFKDFEVDVTLVWEPAWSPSMISREGKDFLKMS